MSAADPVHRGGARLCAVAVLAIAPALALLTPAPTTSWAALTAPSQDVTAPLLAVVTLLAWACSAWLLLVVAVTSAGSLPGVLGQLARALGPRLAPAPVRGLVRVALGGAVALSVLGGSSGAFADDRPVAPWSSYDWPGVAVQAPSRPAPPAARPAPVARPAAVPGPAVVVRAGDSLWTIAARELGPRATPTQVAQAWPRWWSANRAVLGDHPGLIHPGDRLSRPTTR